MDHPPPPASALAGFIAWRLMDLDAREPAAEIPWEQLVEATVETAELGVAAGVRSPELALRILAHLDPARSELDPDALLEMWAFPFMQGLAADALAPDASQAALLVRVAAEALMRIPEPDRAPVRRDRLPGHGDLAAAQTLCLAHGLAFGLTAPELAARAFRDRLRSEIGDGVVPEESVGQLMDLAAAVVHEALLDFERALGPLPEAPAAMRSARLVQERLRELVRRPDWREQLIAEVEDSPIGFIQIIDPAREDSRYRSDCPTGLRAIDIWIGEETFLGRGLGTEMMRLAIDRCFADPTVDGILIDPMASNDRARRFYERLGFRFVEYRSFGDDDCAVYRLDRAIWSR